MGTRSEQGGGGEAAAPPLKRRLRLNSPLAQVILVGLVCFCCPGMFNALSGMGGAGQVDHAAANNANTALYAVFSVAGVLGGAAFNLLGPRPTLFFGCSTYLLYAASFLHYNHFHDQSFVVAAGAFLGIGAGLLWAAQGAILTTRPPPARKASFFAVFWCIFNTGGVVGGAIPFAMNYNRAAAASVNDGTYVVFMGFMAAGAALALAVLPVGGGPVTARAEAAEIAKLFVAWKALLIAPAAWASNFFYAYQFNDVNGVVFNLRTAGLNNVFYWAAQMAGSAGIAWVLDGGARGRRRRGLLGIATVAAVSAAVWGGGLANQLRYTSGKWEKKLDFKDSGKAYAGPVALYCGYGLLDAAFQSLIYWVIGAMADDPHQLSRYSGFYKGIQSAGAAVAWQVDKRHTPLLTQLLINWGLTTASLPLLALLVFLAVEDEAGKEIVASNEYQTPSQQS
ncbi:UNC93-like protein 1 [Wolffia australiana]